MVPLVTHCTNFEATRELLAKPDEVELPVSGDSSRTFVGATGGTGTDLTGDNARDLWFLSDDLLKICLVRMLLFCQNIVCYDPEMALLHSSLFKSN
jgi:hypothetical protein